MFRARQILFASARGAGGFAAPWPYQRVVRAMEKEGKGLLVGADVFKQFEQFYHNQLETAREKKMDSGTAATATATASLKPLTTFCGSPDDVEPLAVLLLKVLCDLQRLEEMRFLFTQCLLELDCSSSRPPSVELFNVYLLAISMTDTFNQNEVENLVDIMQSKGVVPDVVTKFSMLILYLRLGQDSCLAWLPAMLEEAKAIVASGEAAHYPLLPLRIQHCFQTMLRLHCEPTAVHDLFTLLHDISPERLTPSLLVPYLLVSVSDAATPPATVVAILDAMEDSPAQSIGSSTPVTTAGAVKDDSETSAVPFLNSETTIMKLLAKCAQWRDAAASTRVHAYLSQHGNQLELSADAKIVASLLHVQCLIGGSADMRGVMAALQVLEAEVPRERCVPGDRPKLFLDSRHMRLLTTDPISNLVAAIRDRAPGGDLRVVTAQLLDAKANESVLVTAISLDLTMAAAASCGDASSAEGLLSEYASTFQVSPTALTYTSLLLAYADAASSAVLQRGVSRVHGLLSSTELADMGVPLTGSLLHAAMEVALAAHDVEAALVVAERHASAGVSVPVKQNGRLLKETSRFVDVACTRRALKALRTSQSVINRAALAACVAELQRCGMNTDTLR